ncbi:MAG: LysM domain-containing protein [Spirochaetaceae bacterium]|nr:MAG: LysM domain-containing protein [Spirochaetaceae bacterium]
MAADDIRVGKRNIRIIIVILAIFNLACLLILIAFPSLLPSVARWLPRRGVAEPVERVAVPDPAPEPVPPPEPEPAPDIPDPGVPERRVIEIHTVQRGDTFYELAGEYWGYPKIWPDLYILNKETHADPDYISPGDRISIFNPLGDPAALSPAQTEALLQAHVDTYKVYRSLGDQSLERGLRTGNQWLIQRGRLRINKAHWLLYSATRFDRRFLELYADQIDERDLRVVRHYLQRFGYPQLNDELIAK